jgi:hypothetical protein
MYNLIKAKSINSNISSTGIAANLAPLIVYFEFGN